MSYTPSGAIEVKDIEAIEAAVKDVRDDATETNWVLLGYAPDKQNGIELIGSGSGGLDELKSKLTPEFLGYGYLRVISGDKESKRPKFISISFSGEKVGLVKKGKMGTHVTDVTKLFIYSHIHVQASLPEDLQEDDLMTRVKKASGADYDSGSNKGGYESQQNKAESSKAFADSQ